MLKVKKYNPCKTIDDLITRYDDYIWYINKDSEWKVYVEIVPVEIFGLDLKGKTGSFSLEDLLKYL